MAREKAMVREADSALDYVKPDAAARGPSDFQLAIKDLKRLNFSEESVFL